MEKLLTIEQLSELIQVSKSTIYHWTHTGYVPHYKLPKGLRFRGSEIEYWIKRKQHKGRDQYRIVID